jgi:hypothetical protein
MKHFEIVRIMNKFIISIFTIRFALDLAQKLAQKIALNLTQTR